MMRQIRWKNTQWENGYTKKTGLGNGLEKIGVDKNWAENTGVGENEVKKKHAVGEKTGWGKMK